MLAKHILIVLAFFNLSLSLNAQAGEPPIGVIHFFNEKTLTYDIYCENTAPDIYTVELDFDELSGLKPSVPYPLRRTIEPGRHLIMRLRQKEIDDQGYFKIALTYRRGCLKYKLEKNFPYLVPIKEGNIAKLVCSDSLLSFYHCPISSGRLMKKDTILYINGFFAQSGEEITAARRGIVSKVKNYQTDSTLHDSGLGYYLDIQHADGSYARYDGIQKDSMLVEIGQLVEAGEPIALVRKSLSGDTFFSLRIFCYEDRIVTDKIGPSNVKLVMMPIHFQGATSTCCSHFYEVVHPEETIIREMSKRELRRWTRKRAKGKVD
ncbi:MAG: hypothetical protein ACI8YQ_004261 [Polaribacter sp.]|jgi:hypothetical protein